MAPAKATGLMRQILECASETGIEPQVIMQIKNKNYTMDDTVKKFLFCCFNKAAVSTKEGFVEVDKLLDFYPENTNKEALGKAIEECEQSEEYDPMERISGFFQCFQKKTPVTLKIFDK